MYMWLFWPAYPSRRKTSWKIWKKAKLSDIRKGEEYEENKGVRLVK